MNESASGHGRSRATVIVVCCPACSGTNVFRSHWQATRELAYWECRACHHRWKEPKAIGGEGHKAVIP